MWVAFGMHCPRELSPGHSYVAFLGLDPGNLPTSSPTVHFHTHSAPARPNSSLASICAPFLLISQLLLLPPPRRMPNPSGNITSP